MTASGGQLKKKTKSNGKTHWKTLVNPDYIGAYCLNGKDLNVTIEKVVRELVTGTAGKKEECTVAYLTGQKPFIVNRTNAKSISKVVGSPYIEDWAKQTITLYPTVTKLKGEDVECLRVREIQALPVLDASHAKYKAVRDAVKSGSFTMQQVRTKYNVSAEIEKLLLS